MAKNIFHASHSFSADQAVSHLLQQLRNCVRHNQSLLCIRLAVDLQVDGVILCMLLKIACFALLPCYDTVIHHSKVMQSYSVLLA